MPIAYGYGRTSKDEDHQLYSPAVQEIQCKEAWKKHPVAGKLPWGGFFFDPDTSGGTNLCERTAGCALNVSLAADDHLFISKADRAFRSLKDQVNTHELWTARGVSLHFLNLGMDTSTPEGELFLNSMGAFARYERRIIGRRIIEGLREKRRRGSPGRCVPIGWKVSGRQRDALVVPFYEERELCKEVYDAHRAGESYFEISVRFRKECRPRLPRHSDKRLLAYEAWSLHWLKLAAAAYRKNFPCELIENRQRWLREAGRLPASTAS